MDRVASILQSIGGLDSRLAAARLDGIDLYLRERAHGYEHACGMLEQHAAQFADFTAKIAAEKRHKENVNYLTDLANTIIDKAARKSLQKILDDGDFEKIERLAQRLDKNIVMDANRNSNWNEDLIRKHCKKFQYDDDHNRERRERKKLRLKAKQSVSILNLMTGAVGGKDGEKYCSAFEVSLRNQQKSQWQEFAKNTIFEKKNEAGETQQIEMTDILNSSQKKRLAETYALLKGIEDYARSRGLTWIFVTLTAPGRMHPNPTKGQENCDGSTPAESHQWIHQAWRRAEARMRKNDVIVSGPRTTEPMGDGCAHWHMMLFVHPLEIVEVEKALRYQNEWRSEIGCKIMLNDGRAKGASYLFKYITKALGSSEEIKDESNAKVDAWRSTWSIRSMQWIGMPPLKLWRALRKISAPSDGGIKKIWEAVQNGDGAKFIELAGGLNVKKKDRPFAITNEESDLDSKSVTIENRLTGAVETFHFDKWHQAKKEKVAVVLNYPRKENPKPNPKKPTPKTTTRRGCGFLKFRAHHTNSTYNRKI